MSQHNDCCNFRCHAVNKRVEDVREKMMRLMVIPLFLLSFIGKKVKLANSIKMTALKEESKLMHPCLDDNIELEHHSTP